MLDGTDGFEADGKERAQQRGLRLGGGKDARQRSECPVKAVEDAGLECIYEPSVRAFHREKFFRGNGKTSPTILRWTKESTVRMKQKWGNYDLSRWVPEVL